MNRKQQDCSFDKPVLSTVCSFDKLRTNGIEGLRTNGIEGLRTNGITIVPRAPWRVTEVEVLSHYRLEVRFADGVKGLVDMSKLVLHQDSGVFSALRDDSLFRQVRLELGVVTWPFDSTQDRPGDIDLAPDAMHTAIQQNGEWVVS